MFTLQPQKRHIPAFFCLWPLFFLPFTTLYAADTVNHCAQQTFDHMTAIKHVIDGDTVIIENDVHVRMIGIDTPEINYRNGRSETGAVEAKIYLQNLLREGNRVGLIYDAEHQDRYGRMLAHLYLTDGTNVQADLLRHGLAVPLRFPPNLLYSRCYYEAAEQAREQDQGLWRLTQYRPVHVQALPKNASGYRVVYGNIYRISDSGRSLKLHFSPHFIATIAKSDLIFFQTRDINSTLGNQMQVEGEVHKRDGIYWMTIRHPMAIKVLSGAYNSSDKNR